MIKLQESMGLGQDQTGYPWICSRTRYWLRYVARSLSMNTYIFWKENVRWLCFENNTRQVQVIDYSNFKI